jgi:hypothetical protein
LAPTGKSYGVPNSVIPIGIRGHGINYHNGPLLLGKTNIYYIWYGGWDQNSQEILSDFANNIGASPYYNINTTYYDKSNKFISNLASLAGQTFDNGSQGMVLSDSSVENIVANAINAKALPADTNGVYFVLTSADIDESSGFCDSYCGWHSHATLSGVDIKYAFVGNGNRCPSSCQAQIVTPNGNPGADGMANIIANELSSTVTDPGLNAWFDPSGLENADKCQWSFGVTYNTANGALANVRLGSRDYYIQQNWVNQNKLQCALHFP